MKPTILFYDSGMGGLSVYREVRSALPDAQYLYCFDNAFFPYSEKDEQTLIQRALLICGKINELHSLDMVVVACNTASTVVLPALRQALSCSVVGTVPAIKPAAEISQTKTLGLLATKGTVKRSYVNELISNYANHCKVLRIGSTKLVEIAEQKIYGNSVDLLALRTELEPWIFEDTLDTLVLGCTHFPLLKDEIHLCLPQVKYFMDPAKAIAKRVVFLLKDILGQVTKERLENKENLIFYTAHFEHEQNLQKVLSFWGFNKLAVLNLKTENQ